MRRILSLVFAAVAVVALGGCSLLPRLETPVPTLVPPTPGPTVDPASALGQAQTAWAAAGITSYTWTIGYSCECAGALLKVTVVDGVATKVQSLQKVLNKADLQGWPLTVDDVLAKAASAVDGGGAVRGTYDANGVPTQLTMDFQLNAIDDELSFGRMSFDPAP
jgi:uncharacterized protein DUF6174